MLLLFRRGLMIRVFLAWYDLWVGAYWDRRNRVLYVSLVPTLVFQFRFRKKESN